MRSGLMSKVIEMGQAKRRKDEIAKLKERSVAWRAGLTAEEKVIANVAERLDERLVRGMRFSEGCYHLAFFMAQYLAERGIIVSPIIGWVNDGTWQGVTSHAWIEFNGKKTDASLTCTKHVDAVPTGALIIHDHIVRKGMATYSYFSNDDPAVQARIAWMRSDNDLSKLHTYKEAQHAQMQAIAAEKRFSEYLSMAPMGTRYTDLVHLIEG